MFSPLARNGSHQRAIRAQVSREWSAKRGVRGWDESGRARGKVANFTETNSPSMYVCTCVCLCVRAVEELMVIPFTILPSHCEYQRYFTQCALKSTYELLYNVAWHEQHDFVNNIMSYITDWTCLTTIFFFFNAKDYFNNIKTKWSAKGQQSKLVYRYMQINKHAVFIQLSLSFFFSILKFLQNIILSLS